MVYTLSHIHDYDNDYSKDLAELLPHNRNQGNSQKIYIDSECFQRF